MTEDTTLLTSIYDVTIYNKAQLLSLWRDHSMIFMSVRKVFHGVTESPGERIKKCVRRQEQHRQVALTYIQDKYCKKKKMFL